MFFMNGGSLTIDRGKYMVSGGSRNIVSIPYGTAGGRIEINDGYFQSIRGSVIFSESKKNENPPQVVINSETFVSEKAVWGSPNYDVTKGTVNEGTTCLKF